MSKRNVLIAMIAFLLGVFATSGQTRMSEGAKPYSPTRLQWLALDMEAQMHVELLDQDGYSIDFIARESENTILIYVRYLPRVNREIMNMRIENARDVINVKAKNEGWLSWVKIREDVKMAEGATK